MLNTHRDSKLITGSVDGEKNANSESNNNRFSILFKYGLTTEKASKKRSDLISLSVFLFAIFPNINVITLVS